jgi:polysaccharide export outer membrane protein
MKAALVSSIVFACGCGALLCAMQQAGGPATAPSTYLLGLNDQVIVDVLELPEFHGRPFRVEWDGSVDLPLIGNVPAAGHTLAQFKDEVSTRLRAQVRDPHVVISLSETKSQPVSVMGEVNAPGTQQMDGQKTLFDVLAGAGGLKSDAGDEITVTRQRVQGQLGLPNATVDPASGSTVAEVKVHDLVDLKDPAVNIVMRPHDAISVPKARVLYVIGNVRKPGGFTLSDKRSLSALEALSLAEGLGPNAAPKSARILRRTAEGQMARQQIPIDLKSILAGKTEDISLRPDDILFVPDNGSRRVAAKAAETALATISGVVIWRGL